MDFLERYFHISPDGGSGISEAGYVIAVAALLFVAFHRIKFFLSTRS
jgi:hypothetical protein